MPKRDHKGYTITTQHTLWEGEIRYRYTITRLARAMTHTWSEWDYTNELDAVNAAKAEVDTLQGATA